MPDSAPRTALCQALQNLKGRVAVAFSGGVDSTYLLQMAKYGTTRAPIALIAVSEFLSQRELKWARRVARQIRLHLVEVQWSPLSEPTIRINRNDRCYQCKLAMYKALWKQAVEINMVHLLDGTNLDDLGLHRPGLRASSQLNVGMPLASCGMTKAEIRLRSAELGLPTWSRASQSCLATRVPHGTALTTNALRRIELAEQILLDLGIEPVRVRDGGDTAVVQVSLRQRNVLQRDPLWARIAWSLGEIGFRSVTLDEQTREEAIIPL
jgi:uncharacterized protein